MVMLVTTPGRSVNRTSRPALKTLSAAVCSSSQFAVVVSQAVLEVEFQMRLALVVNETVFVRVRPAPVPVIVMGNVPTGALEVVVSVNVEEPLPLKDEGTKSAVTPVGKPLAPRLTLEPNPFKLVRFT